jgi:hypothetical protein
LCQINLYEITESGILVGKIGVRWGKKSKGKIKNHIKETGPIFLEFFGTF